MSTIRKSQVQIVPLAQGSQYSSTNQLYRPLRETLQHPEIVRKHAEHTPAIAQSSLLSKHFRRMNTLELQELQKNIYVPDGELVPTNNINLVRGEKFYAVDASERIAGPPISEQDLDRIRNNGMKTSQIVYQVRQPQMQEEKKVAYQAPSESYSLPNYSDYGKQQQNFKYNLFSCIDQPFNECRELGCGKCTGCPSNEIIASEINPNNLNQSARS